MNPVSSLQAALVSILVAAGSVLVGYGILSSAQEGQWITLAGAVVAAAFLIANSIHAHAPAK